jgi:hypothetical protein
MAINVPEPIVPPLKDISYFGGSLVEFDDFAHKRAPIIWVADDINDGAGNTLQIEWSKLKWAAKVAGNFPANHPDLPNVAFGKGLVGDFFDEAKAFFNAGNFPNARNDHLLMGDIIVGKDIEGNIVRLVITEQHELAAQGMIRP